MIQPLTSSLLLLLLLLLALMASISDLPPEVILRIFSYLDTSSLARVSITSHLLHTIGSDQTLWRSRCLHDWPLLRPLLTPPPPRESPSTSHLTVTDLLKRLVVEGDTAAILLNHWPHLDYRRLFTSVLLGRISLRGQVLTATGDRQMSAFDAEVRHFAVGMFKATYQSRDEEGMSHHEVVFRPRLRPIPTEIFWAEIDPPGPDAEAERAFAAGDEVEVQWRLAQNGPYGWWRGFIEEVGPHPAEVAVSFPQFPLHHIWFVVSLSSGFFTNHCCTLFFFSFPMMQAPDHSLHQGDRETVSLRRICCRDQEGYESGVCNLVRIVCRFSGLLILITPSHTHSHNMKTKTTWNDRYHTHTHTHLPPCL